MDQLDKQVENLDRLMRILKCVRLFYGLHPAVVKDEYGNAQAYLRRHLSEQDRIFAALSMPFLLEPESPLSLSLASELVKNACFRPINGNPATPGGRRTKSESEKGGFV